MLLFVIVGGVGFVCFVFLFWVLTSSPLILSKFIGLTRERCQKIWVSIILCDGIFVIIGFECEPIHMVLLLFWTEKDLNRKSFLCLIWDMGCFRVWVDLQLGWLLWLFKIWVYDSYLENKVFGFFFFLILFCGVGDNALSSFKQTCHWRLFYLLFHPRTKRKGGRGYFKTFLGSVSNRWVGADLDF